MKKREPPEIYVPIEGEIFVPVTNSNVYFVSNLGRVKSTARSYRTIILATRQDKDGYVIIPIYNNKRLHRLIAQAFIPNPHNYSQINHIDGVKTNNTIDNLEWCDVKRNISHAIETGLNMNFGETHSNAKLTEIDVLRLRSELKNTNLTIKQLAVKYNISYSQVRFIRDRRSWKKI